MNNRPQFVTLFLVGILTTGFTVSTVKAQEGFDRASATNAIMSFYESRGEWAGAFHITSITAMEAVPQGPGRWLVNARYNFVGYGKDRSGANRSGETGTDQRTFNLVGSGGSYTVTGMGGHMSAQFGASGGTNTNAGDQLRSMERHSNDAARAKSLEDASDTAQKGVDKSGTFAGHLDSFQSNRGVSAVPQKYQNNPEIMRYDQEARRAATQRDKLDQEIAKLEKQGASATNQAGVEL